MLRLFSFLKTTEAPKPLWRDETKFGEAKIVSCRETERSVLEYVSTVSQTDDELQAARACLG